MRKAPRIITFLPSGLPKPLEQEVGKDFNHINQFL
jgi:hypothetical protein